jgi:hypothetical protein
MGCLDDVRKESWGVVDLPPAVATRLRFSEDPKLGLW